MNYQLASFVTSYGISKQLPKSTLPEIAFAGRSNVGKSSLINKLVNRKALARTSAVPGKTATINFYKVDQCYFVDLPGYGFAKVSKDEKTRWSELMEGYFRQERSVALVVLLVDIRHEPSRFDVDMVNYLVEREFPFVIALTKMDKLSPTQKKKRLEEIKSELPYGDEIHLLPVSAVTGEGIQEFRTLLDEIVDEEEE